MFSLTPLHRDSTPAPGKERRGDGRREKEGKEVAYLLDGSRRQTRPADKDGAECVEKMGEDGKGREKWRN